MAERLGEALLELGTDDRKLKRGLSKAEKTTRKTLVSMQKMFAGLMTAAAVTGVVRSMNRVIGRLDLIGKQASKLGLTVEALQEFRFAAELSGIAVTTFDMAFQRFIRRAGEAAKETGEAKDALKELGFTLNDLRNLSPEELFMKAAAALAEVEKTTDRLRLSMKLFDSEGVAVLNMVDRLEELRQEARDLGIVLSGDLIRDATAMGDALTKIIAQMDASFARFSVNAINALNTVFGFLPKSTDTELAKTRMLLRQAALDMEIFAAARSGDTAEDTAARRAPFKTRMAELEELIVQLEKLAAAEKKVFDVDFNRPDVGEGMTPKERAKFVTGLTRSIEDQIGALTEQALAFELSGGALAENIALTRTFTEANRERVDLTIEEKDQIRDFASQLRDQADALIEVSEAHRKAAEEERKQAREMERLSDSFADAIVNIRDAASALSAFQSILTRFLSQQASSGLSSLFTNIAGSLFGGGGAAATNAGGSVTGTSSVPSFAHGASFTVGGRGGIDRNLIQFNASRGEQIDITPAGRSRGGVEVNIFAPPGSTVQEDRQQVGDMERINIIIDNATAQNLRPGTQTSRALRSVHGLRQQLIPR